MVFCTEEMSGFIIKDKSKRELFEAVWKKAVGYTTSETVEESVFDNGEYKLGKQRVTTKESPPDIAAAKLLLEMMDGEDMDSMTDEELEQEKQRLLLLLRQREEKDEADKGS